MSNLPQTGCSPSSVAPATPTTDPKHIVVDASLFASERDNHPEPIHATYGAIVGERHEIRETKAGARCVSFVQYAPNATRGNTGVVTVTAVVLDFDHITYTQLQQVFTRLAGGATIIYSSFSDGAGGPEDRCSRVIVPLSRPVTPAEMRAVRGELLKDIGVTADEKAAEPARMWFLPSCPAARSSHAFISYNTGTVLDPDPFLARAEASMNATTSMTVSGGAAVEGAPSRKMTLAKIRARLERLGDPESRPAISAVLNGQAFAEKGARDSTLWQVISTAAFVAPDADPQLLVDLVAPSLQVMATAEPHDHLTLDDAADMAVRALADAKEKKVKVFERGDEVEIAKVVVDTLTADGDLVHAEGDFYRFNASTGLYEVVPREALSREIQSFAGRLVVGQGKARVLRISRGTVEGALRLAADQVSRPFFFDAAPTGIAFKGTFVRVTEPGIHVEPLGRQHRARTALPFEYDRHATAPRFAQYLDEVFSGDTDAAAKKDALQEFSGACLAGIATLYAKALVLLGAGRNGKSVFIDILLALFPESAKAAVPPQSFESDYHRALLAGKLINSVAELPRADILRGEAFKAIVAGDVVTARQIYFPPVKFRPKAGHIMAANLLPGSDDLTTAFFERMLIVQFNRFFQEGEREKNLTQRIVTTELAGVAAWALEGVWRLLSRGDHGAYTEPPSHSAVLAEWRLRADQIRQYIEERTRPTTVVANRVQASVLYNDYRRWAQENGHKVLSNPSFGERVKALGIRRVKPHAVAFYEVELLPPSWNSPSQFRRNGPPNPVTPAHNGPGPHVSPRPGPPVPPEGANGGAALQLPVPRDRN